MFFSKAINFECLNCGKGISTDSLIGTLNRNHCPFCLYSKHVDQNIPGDRKSKCQAGMEPVGLTFKHEGFDKYGREKQGEIMLIHLCPKDQKISINRIAGDDDPEIILKIFQNSQNLDLEMNCSATKLTEYTAESSSVNHSSRQGEYSGSRIKKKLKEAGINLLEKQDEPEILRQLYGKK